MFEPANQQIESLHQDAPAGAGPERVPEGLRRRAASAYTTATGEYLGFGADFGAGDLAAPDVEHE